mgnify:CR=1 FL=1
MTVQQIEKRFYRLVSDLSSVLGAERVGDAIGEFLTGASKTKASVDRNLDTLLAMANIPSRADYRRLQTKLDSLQGSLMNLSRKLDRLQESVANGADPCGVAKGGRGPAARDSGGGSAAKVAKKRAAKKKTAKPPGKRTAAGSKGAKPVTDRSRTPASAAPSKRVVQSKAGRRR